MLHVADTVGVPALALGMSRCLSLLHSIELAGPCKPNPGAASPPCSKNSNPACTPCTGVCGDWSCVGV
eukprot:2484320-Prymnesium_polylepis.1